MLRDAEVDTHVPALCDVEVVAGLRRGLARNLISQRRAAAALEDYRDLPVTRHGHQTLLPRAMELRRNFSAYDATYVALTERAGGALPTADTRLARATRAHTAVPITPLSGDL